MMAVFRHELRSSFHSMTAYVFAAFLLAMIGVGAMLYNIELAVSNFEYVLSFGSLAFVVVIPILTMRSLAEERRQKTDQLLYSLPLSTFQVILGKYAALLVLYLVPLCVVALYPLIFAQFGEVYLPTAYGSLLAFFLLGAALIAVLLSLVVWRMTGSASTAYAFCLVLCVALVFLTYLDSSMFDDLLPTLMASLSLFERFTPFVNGMFDMSAVVFYLSVIVFFLFLSVQSMEKRRYNG